MKTTPKTPNNLTLTGSVDIQAASVGADGKPKIPTFAAIAYTGGLMHVAGFSVPVAVDLTGLGGVKASRPVLRDHDLGKIVGHTTAIEVRGNELLASGLISGAGEAAKEVLTAAANSFPWQMSLGASIDTREFVAAGKTATVNGKTITGPALIARKAKLGEISFVGLGADDQTSASIAASNRTKMDITTNPDAAGTNPNDERERAMAIMGYADRAIKGGCDRNVIEAKRDEAIKDGTDDGKFAGEMVELLQASRPQATGRYQARSDGSGMKEGDVIEASLCLSAGLGEEFVGKQYGEKVTDAAVSKPMQGFSLHGIIRHVIRAAGHQPPDRINAEAIRIAFESDRQIKATGFSTVSLPGILGNVANKTMLNAFEAVPTTWRLFSGRTSLSDFREAALYRLTLGGTYVEVAEGGEIKHATLTESDYSAQLKTYGRMIALTRQMIINDDMQAFTAMPRLLGRLGAVSLELQVYTTLMAGVGSFFHSSNANYLSGVTVGTNDSRLNTEGLTRAETAFLNQTDPAGLPTLISPRVLLVPPALSITAAQLMNSTELRDTTANTQTLTTNAFAGRFTVGVSPYLSNAAITGNSATGFYLLASPTDIAAIVVGFLEGREVPTVESEDAEFNQLGVQWRAFHDWSVSLGDPRAALFSKGAA